jgi:hypothetical protein
MLQRRKRRFYTAAESAEVWDRWRKSGRFRLGVANYIKPLALLANPRYRSSLWYQGIARQGESND